ncbi:unnamed protein product [Amaranthus hypochondriacus]
MYRRPLVSLNFSHASPLSSPFPLSITSPSRSTAAAGIAGHREQPATAATTLSSPPLLHRLSPLPRAAAELHWSSSSRTPTAPPQAQGNLCARHHRAKHQHKKFLFILFL